LSRPLTAHRSPLAAAGGGAFARDDDRLGSAPVVGPPLRYLKPLCVWASLAACIACGSDDPADVPPGEIDLPITTSELGNGLTVVVVPSRAQPIVSAMVTFRSGAFVEDETQSGYSHLLEHMIFQGTTKVPDSSEFLRQLDSLGALSNGLTGRDMVRYYYTLPSDNLGAGLEMLADSIRAPELDPTRLQKEIRVVLAELDLADTDSRDVQYRRTFELLFDTYPNRVNPIGTRSQVDATSEALRELHDTYYVPNNAQLILAGDVTPAAAQTLAGRFFGDWSRSADPFTDHVVPVHPALRADVSDTLTAPVSASRLMVAYQGPSRSEDFRASVAADLLAELTVQSSSAFRSLVSPPQITSAEMIHYPSSHKGVIMFGLQIGSGHEAAAIASLGRMHMQLAQSITDEELRTAKSALWQQRLNAADQNLNLALQLASDWALGPAGGTLDYIDTLYDLKREDVVELIDRYLNRRHRAAVLLTDPKHRLPDLDAALERTW
jgi:zinc protease